MKIKKMYQGTVPENKILNTYSDSQTDTYSCDYINNNGGGGNSDLSNYYNKTETEDLIDNKIETIPTNDLLHYKGHLASVDNLPSAGQPSAPEVAPVLSVGTLKSTWAISDFNITKFKELLGSYKYLIGSGGLNMSSSLLTRARIFFNSSSVLDSCCPISDSYLALHFNASATQPVYVYGTTDIKKIYYDDGTTQDTTTTTTEITKPFWTRLTLNSTVGSSIIYTVSNLDFNLKLKFPPTSLNFLSDNYVTIKSTSLNRFYKEGDYILEPIGLVENTTSWFRFYDGSPTAEAVKNNFYTVGENYDIYVCDSTPAWKLWSKSEEVDLSNYYTKEETNTTIDNKIAEIPETDLSNYYNKGEVDNLIENIPSSGESVTVNNAYNTSTNETYSCSYINNLSAGEGVDLSNYYTKTETDTAIDNKIADIPKTDLTNYYTKTETDTLINNKTFEEVYSTTEQRIGTWLGKPLYRKTFNFTDSVSSTNKIQKSHNISNVDTIFIDTSHSFITSEADGTFPLPSIGYFGNFNDRLEVNVDKTYIRIHSETTWDTSWTKVVTLLYTKTTD